MNVYKVVIGWVACAALACGGDDAIKPTVEGRPADASMARFIAVGDTGTGEDEQFEVARAMQGVCFERGCDFIAMLGDNIYESGVDSVDDAQWQEKFELPYADLDLPFHPAPGNHDFGGELVISTPGLGNEFQKGDFQVQYSERSEKWSMPWTHYTVRYGPVGLVVIDTNSLVWGDVRYGDQFAWFRDAVAGLEGATWIFATGHHPVRSNGSHGNVGNFDTIEVFGEEIPNPVAELSGVNLEEFFADEMCGNVDAYFAGHDHNLQWVNDPDALCGAELIVSGSGGKLKEFEQDRNELFFGFDSSQGFIHVEATDAMWTGRFYDKDGELLFERVVAR